MSLGGSMLDGPTTTRDDGRRAQAFHMTVRFGRSTLDRDSFRITLDGEEVSVEPQVFDVLAGDF
ncbi:MAG: hypothetical protein AAGF91_05730, partial [Actinomycetota bacterium]